MSFNIARRNSLEIPHLLYTISATSNQVEPSRERLGFSTGFSLSSIIGTPRVLPSNTSEDKEDDDNKEELVTCSRACARVCLQRLPSPFSLISLFVYYQSFLRLLFNSLVVIIYKVSASSSSLLYSSLLQPIVASISSSLSVVQSTLAIRRKIQPSPNQGYRDIQ